MTQAQETALEIRGLRTEFRIGGQWYPAVRDLSLSVAKNETLAIVGESGSGKSVMSQSIVRLLEPSSSIEYEGAVLLEGRNLLELPLSKLRAIRGNEISVVFQDPLTSLNPVHTIGDQIEEVLRLHQKLSRKEARERAIELLRLTGIPSPEARVHDYPHQLSGGMQQRVMIAIALACNPALLIADEPTTALDVTIQAQILQLMKELQQKTNSSIILITHDLGIVVDLCDRVIVMYAGQIVETGTKWEIFRNPQHPYTKGLLKSLPRLDQPKDEPLVPIYGTPPDMVQPPQGCGFCSRCESAMRICEQQDPDWTAISETQQVRCWLQSAGEKAAAVIGGKEAGA